MKKVHMIILSVILAVGLTGCGKDINSQTTELTEETTEEYMEPEETEALLPSSDRVYGEDCAGVFTISINPEVDLEIDKDGNVLSVVFQNEDAETAYKELSLEGIQAEDAVKIILETADEKGYLKDDEHMPEGGEEPASDGLCRTCRGTGIMTIQAQTCYTYRFSGIHTNS